MAKCPWQSVDDKASKQSVHGKVFRISRKHVPGLPARRPTVYARAGEVGLQTLIVHSVLDLSARLMVEKNAPAAQIL